MGGKWVQILRDIAPGIDRVAVLMHPQTAAHLAFWREAEATAQRLGIAPTAAHVHDAAEIEQAVATLASRPHGGLVVLPHTVTEVNRDLIITLAMRHGLPSISAFPSHPTAGGLSSHGVRRAVPFLPPPALLHPLLRGAHPASPPRSPAPPLYLLS